MTSSVLPRPISSAITPPRTPLSASSPSSSQPTAHSTVLRCQDMSVDAIASSRTVAGGTPRCDGPIAVKKATTAAAPSGSATAGCMVLPASSRRRKLANRSFVITSIRLTVLRGSFYLQG